VLLRGGNNDKKAFFYHKNGSLAVLRLSSVRCRADRPVSDDRDRRPPKLTGIKATIGCWLTTPARFD
jgi:hypothetical protein